MVAAAMAEFQLVGFGTAGQRDQLMAQADAEDGYFSDQIADRFNRFRQIFRVSRTVREHDTVRGGSS